LRKEKTPNNNLSRNQFLALRSLRNNEDIVILKAEKGGDMVMMNKVDYVKKVRDHLYNSASYKNIKDNPIS